jgi:DNA-directed RNA polymerase specialized sigma24 family protein
MDQINVEGLTLEEISLRTGLSKKLLYSRYCKGMKSISTITAPLGGKSVPAIKIEGKTLRQISYEYHIPLDTLKRRYKRGANTLQEITNPNKFNGTSVSRSEIMIDGKTLNDIAFMCDKSYSTIKHRYDNGARTIEALTMSSCITVEGKSLSEIANIAGVSRNTIVNRYRRGANTIEDLVNYKDYKLRQRKPKRTNAIGGTLIYVGGKSIREIADDCGLSTDTIYHRYYRGAHTIEELTRPYRQRRSLI